MNAPPNIDPAARFVGDVVHWLTNGTRDQRFIDNIFAEMCVRIQAIRHSAEAVDAARPDPASAMARRQDPVGRRDARGRDFARSTHDVRERSEYIGSPANEIHDGATEVRENLERDPALGRKHAVYDEMRANGLTDYVAWPLYHTLGKRHIVTFATDRPGGFDDAHIAGLQKTVAGAGAGQRNPDQEPAGANAARNLCRVACRRTHSGRRHPARQRDDGARRHHDLRSARFHPDLGQLAARRRHRSPERLFRRDVGADRAAWRRNPEIHRRRPARDFSAQRARGLRQSAACRVRSPSGHGRAEREERAKPAAARR